MEAADQRMQRMHHTHGSQDQWRFKERSTDGIAVIPVTIASLGSTDAGVAGGVHAVGGVVVGGTNHRGVFVQIGDAVARQAHGDVHGPTRIERGAYAAEAREQINA